MYRWGIAFHDNKKLPAKRRNDLGLLAIRCFMKSFKKLEINEILQDIPLH